MQSFINSYNDYIYNISQNGKIAILIMGCIICLWLIILIPFQVIIHEGGHCIFGFLTGYRFISFRLFGFTLVKFNRKYCIQKYNIPGSFGQCLMKPSKNTIEKRIYVLFIMGGVITDLAVSIISAFLMMGPIGLSFIARIGFFITALYTFGSSLINGIPWNRNTLNTDGLNLLCMIMDMQAVTSYFTQLAISAGLQEGLTYKDFPIETFSVPIGADLSNELIAWHKIMECYYCMDIRHWDDALRIISELEKSEYRKSRMRRYTELTEKLFLYIKLEKNISEIEALYENNKKILNKKEVDFNLSRVRMAYEIYKDNSQDNKDRIRKEIDKRTAGYPYKGEAAFCAGLIGDMLNEG